MCGSVVGTRRQAKPHEGWVVRSCKRGVASRKKRRVRFFLSRSFWCPLMPSDNKLPWRCRSAKSIRSRCLRKGRLTACRRTQSLRADCDCPVVWVFLFCLRWRLIPSAARQRTLSAAGSRGSCETDSPQDLQTETPTT